MTKQRRAILIEDIASREYTAKELEDKYGLDRDALLDFRDTHIEEITLVRKRLDEDAAIAAELGDRDIPIWELLRQLSDVELSSLWIIKKSQRLLRYQTIVDLLFTTRDHDATTLREIRSYLSNAAEELGQLPNRGSATDGEDTKASYTIIGVDPDELK